MVKDQIDLFTVDFRFLVFRYSSYLMALNRVKPFTKSIRKPEMKAVETLINLKPSFSWAF